MCCLITHVSVVQMRILVAQWRLWKVSEPHPLERKVYAKELHYHFRFQNIFIIIISYSTITGFLQSEKTVTDDRPFKCTNNCGRYYKRKQDLNRHLNYESSTQPQFFCIQCKQRFTKKENLRRHLTNIHKIDHSQHVS